MAKKIWHGRNAWNAANPERCRVYAQRSIARRRGVENTLTHEEWAAVLDAHEWKCAYCFGAFEEMEHIVPMSRGGANSRANVVPACHNCNMQKVGRNLVPHLASRFWPPSEHLLAA